MRIIKNLKDMSLNEDERFFADLIKEEFGWNTCVEKIKNKDFLQRHAKPLNDFTIYTTAQPTAEGMRMIAWKKRSNSSY